jgi:hypothetical protein
VNHVFGLVGDKTLYATHLFAMEQNVGNVVHNVVTPSINPPPHSFEPPALKVARKLGLNFNKLFLWVHPIFAKKKTKFLFSFYRCINVFQHKSFVLNIFFFCW